MKKNLIYSSVLFLACITCNLNAQTPEQKFNTLKERVNSQGENPGQTYSNMYIDKLTAFFYNNGWKDEIIPSSVKSIRVAPPDDPSDWYYFVSVKTKNCSTPFYLSYDIGDSNLGELFIIEPAGYPVEFKNYISAEKAKLANKKMEQAEAAKTANLMWPKVYNKMKSYRDTMRLTVNKYTKEMFDTTIASYSSNPTVNAQRREVVKKWFYNQNPSISVSYSIIYNENLLASYLEENSDTSLVVKNFLSKDSAFMKQEFNNYKRDLNNFLKLTQLPENR